MAQTTTPSAFRPRHLALLPLLGVLGACTVAPPTGPMVLATPPQGKDLSVFQGEDIECRNYAQATLGGSSPALAANQSAVGSAVAGTALGAATGALIGSAGAAAGAGAAVGAGVGLLAGSAIGAQNARISGAGMQYAYDQSYAQCMASRGNQVQAGVVPPAAGYGFGAVPYATPYATPYYAPYYAAAPYSYYAPAYPVPGITLGFGVYRGWGYHRPWYYGRPYGGGGWGYRGGWRRH